MHTPGLPKRLIAVGSALILLTVGPQPAARADADPTGATVFLDPGHSGLFDASMTRQVPTGRGGTKDCQTPISGPTDSMVEATWPV
jgi:N-acetylmuramoyl-L-alanine amidase